MSFCFPAGSRWVVAPMLLAALALSSAAAADLPITRLSRALRAAGASRPLGSHHAALLDSRGRVPLLVPLPAGVDAADRGLLPVAPGLGAIHLTPDELESWSAAHPDLSPSTAPPRWPLVDVAGGWTRAPAFRAQTGFDGSGVVVGIVDTGLDVSHADFRDADGRTRVAWLLRREPPAGLHPDLEDAYGCTAPAQTQCAVYGREDIDALLEGNPDGAPRDSAGHGTHVTSIAAGNGGLGGSGKPRYVGVAPGATIIVASPSSGGGFSDPDIINSARFIFEQADKLGMPAVVNISLGSDFGAHDGTSPLERGLAALVGDNEPGRVLVLAAGNSGALYTFEDAGPFGIHTEAHTSTNAVTRVPIRQPGADGQEISGAGFVWVGLRPGDEVSVGLEGPEGEDWIEPVGPGEEGGYEEGEISAGVINNIIDERTQLSAESNGVVLFWEGRWPGDEAITVLLEGRGDAQLWVTGTGAAAPGATVGLVFEKATKNGTIAVPASHPDLLAVGCTLNRISWRPFGTFDVLELQSFGAMSPPVEDSTCYFSAAGPTPAGGMKPNLLAPGAFVAAAMSRHADPRTNSQSIFAAPGCPDPERPCYLVDNTHALSSGTSMSAPFVAGAAALLLQAEPNLTQGQMMEILAAGAARPRGLVPYDYQQGPGELDLVGALQVLEERQTGGGGVDVTRSWYALSSPYLRPDPSWQVEGVVELRHADGSIALEVPQSRVELRIAGGEVVSALTRVRAGLFRFAITAPRGSGGTTATLDVRYQGASLGKRKIPIGVDAWAATGGVQPVGGCAVHPVSPAGAARRPGAALPVFGEETSLLAGLALALAWRRRRPR